MVATLDDLIAAMIQNYTSQTLSPTGQPRDASRASLSSLVKQATPQPLGASAVPGVVRRYAKQWHAAAQTRKLLITLKGNNTNASDPRQSDQQAAI